MEFSIWKPSLDLIKSSFNFLNIFKVYNLLPTTFVKVAVIETVRDAEVMLSDIYVYGCWKAIKAMFLKM